MNVKPRASIKIRGNKERRVGSVIVSPGVSRSAGAKGSVGLEGAEVGERNDESERGYRGRWMWCVNSPVRLRRRTVVRDWKNMKRMVRFGVELRTVLFTNTI